MHTKAVKGIYLLRCYAPIRKRQHAASLSDNAEKIWGLIQEIVSAIAETLSTDFDELLTKITNQNIQLFAMMKVVQQLQLAA